MKDSSNSTRQISFLHCLTYDPFPFLTWYLWASIYSFIFFCILANVLSHICKYVDVCADNFVPFHVFHPSITFHKLVQSDWIYTHFDTYNILYYCIYAFSTHMYIFLLSSSVKVFIELHVRGWKGCYRMSTKAQVAPFWQHTTSTRTLLQTYSRCASRINPNSWKVELCCDNSDY